MPVDHRVSLKFVCECIKVEFPLAVEELVHIGRLKERSSVKRVSKTKSFRINIDVTYCSGAGNNIQRVLPVPGMELSSVYLPASRSDQFEKNINSKILYS